MTAADAFLVSQRLLGAGLAVVLLWDAYAYLRFGDTATVSHWFWTQALVRPWFPWAVAAVEVGLWVHFFWGYWRGGH